MPSPRRTLRAAAVGPALAVMLLAATAGAQSNDKVAAEALFEDGRRLVAAGNFAEACPKFADSQRLDPSPATLLNLASCYEKSGRTASAWATYREAASAASAAGRAEYITTAQRHAEALGPRLGRLALKVEQPVAGLQIVRDGARVDPAAWGEAIPLDPGSHTIEASAPGFKGWASSVSTQDGAQANITIPALEPLPSAEAAPPSPAPPSTKTQVLPEAHTDFVTTVVPTSPAPSTGGGQRTMGVVLGAAGLVGLGLGGVFSVVAKNKYNSSLPSCETGNPGLCNSTGVSERDDARGFGDAASVAVVVGAAALAGGLVVWITAPHGEARAATAASLGIAPAPGGAVLQGAW
jgi:hypothetical protein